MTLLRFHGFWARLQDINFAVNAITTPLNIHGALIMFFNDHCIARKFDDLIIGKRKTIALRYRHINGTNSTAFCTLWIELHLEKF